MNFERWLGWLPGADGAIRPISLQSTLLARRHAFAVLGQAGVPPGHRGPGVAGHWSYRRDHQLNVGPDDDLHIRGEPIDPSGIMALCVADGEMAGCVAADPEMKHGITTATLTKDGPQGGGLIAAAVRSGADRPQPERDRGVGGSVEPGPVA
ncbi:hypothetical protein ACFQ7A_01740 [Streptomyces sp. NPDC056528]|uniref:hypothetical protein n=1 Tax=Streptomyces sp. NPDC056528 TaxID=3345854 RepID=UPI00368B2EB1